MTLTLGVGITSNNRVFENHKCNVEIYLNFVSDFSAILLFLEIEYISQRRSFDAVRVNFWGEWDCWKFI